MKKFIITERRPQISVWIYEVEAENEQQAFELVWRGVTESTTYQTEGVDWDEVDYDIEEYA